MNYFSPRTVISDLYRPNCKEYISDLKALTNPVTAISSDEEQGLAFGDSGC